MFPGTIGLGTLNYIDAQELISGKDNGNVFRKSISRKNNPFLLVFTAKIIYSTIAGFIVGYFDPSVFDIPLDIHHLWFRFSLVVIFAPIIETLIFQVLIVEIMRSFKVKDIYSIIFSSLLFASSHSYSITYVLITLVPGLIYALYYVGLRRRYDWFKSASFVFAIHALYNLFVFFTK